MIHTESDWLVEQPTVNLPIRSLTLMWLGAGVSAPGDVSGDHMLRDSLVVVNVRPCGEEALAEQGYCGWQIVGIDLHLRFGSGAHDARR